MNLSRRRFVSSLFVAPAIIPVSNLMPVKLIDWAIPQKEEYALGFLGPDGKVYYSFNNTTEQTLEDRKQFLLIHPWMYRMYPIGVFEQGDMLLVKRTREEDKVIWRKMSMPTGALHFLGEKRTEFSIGVKKPV